jgi:hypothetical protein
MKKRKIRVTGTAFAVLLAVSMMSVVWMGCGTQSDPVEEDTDTEWVDDNTETNDIYPDNTEANGLGTDNGDMDTNPIDGDGVTDGDGMLDDAGDAVEDVVDGVGDAGKDVINGVEDGVDDITGDDATGENH